MILQIRLALSILCATVAVALAIKFDDQLLLPADEVDDERTDGLLTNEFEVG